MRAKISYSSKHQLSVALSSWQAEIVAAFEAAKEVKYQREFLAKLGFTQTNPTTLSVNNEAAIDLAYNPKLHNRTKHIDRRHCYVRELVEDHTLNVLFVKSGRWQPGQLLHQTASRKEKKEKEETSSSPAMLL